MRATSLDVAKRAGVSRATVSYVLNDAPDQTISEDTKRAVLQAARELGYRPHPGARSLRSGRSDIVLFPLPGLDVAHVWSRAIDACATALRARRLTLVTDFTSYESAEMQADAWLRLGPAAVIDLVLTRDDPAHEALRRAGVVVLTAAETPGPAHSSPMDTIVSRARELQVNYVVDRGCRDIVFAVPSRELKAYIDKHQRSAMQRAAKQRGARLRVEKVEFQRDDLRASAKRWREEGVDAVCAYNDELALGLLSALNEQKIRVPRDIAVIGLDDVALSSVVTPTLTSVTVPVEQLGESLAETTARLIDDDELVGAFSIPPYHVVARESA